MPWVVIEESVRVVITPERDCSPGRVSCREMGSAELEIVIAAAVPSVPARYRRPAMVDPFDVSHEMAMVKSALLYADHVSLASWRVSMVNVWARMREHRRAGDAAEVLR